MKQPIYDNLISKTLKFGFFILFTFTTSLYAQEGDPEKGKTLFNTNCAACHKLDGPMTGPPLRNIEQILADEEGLDREWMNAWIRNSIAMVNSGDRYANKIYNEYNKLPMTPFPQLSDEDISDILAYTAQEKAAPVTAGTTAVPGGQADSSSGGSVSTELILGALAVLFGLLVLALFLVRRTLKRFAEAKGIEIDDHKDVSLWRAFVQNQFLVLVTVIFMLLASAYFVYGYFMQIGVDQGYEPVQPIHYSHRIHAGDNEIDCKYCHSSARVSKTAGIPSLNVCMNCHKSISEVSDETLAEGLQYGIDYNEEIEKLYAATGWSPAEQQYTGDPQPVKWIRIHNLPDLSYFNHAQHVTVGGIECQTCHGPVESMEIVSQQTPLTMGWCITCHRETEVKVADNAYYSKIHEELSKKYGVEKLTVAQMGGLECGKCHY